jgi:DNA-directed RNA polymerase specialized sigma24 family protein
MASGGAFAFVLSIVRDFTLAGKVMGEADPREAVLGMSRAGRREIALSREAVAAVERADRKEPPGGWLEAVRKCLEGADRWTRSLLTMRYRDGMSVAEIARRTKAAPAAVHASLFRVRASLAKCIEGRLGAGRG